MTKQTGKSKFSVPDKWIETHPEDKGKKIEFPYEFESVDSDAEATDYFAKKLADAKTDKQKERWSLKGIANGIIEGLARAAEYQKILLQYTPVELAENPDDAFDSAYRDLLAAGIPEDAAKNAIAALKASKAA